MFLYLLLLSFASVIISYEPSCFSCKYFIPHIKNNPDLGLCKIFKNIESKIVIHEFAAHCRKNENVCGKSGFLYEQDDEIIIKHFKRQPANFKMLDLFQEKRTKS